MQTQAKTSEKTRRFKRRPPTSAIHPADLKALIAKAGTSQAQIAHQIGVSDSTMSNVICGRGNSRKVASAIAKAVGKTLDELWPGRYPPAK
jgi:lambda repressor-like predicted transcriptional regulator